MTVPVVLPQAVVTVDDSGHARITVENTGHRTIDCPDEPIGRDELGKALAVIAEQVAGPIRVEVREPDGSRYADILQPHPPQPSAATAPDDDAEGDGRWVSGEGFLPGETVLVAVVATTIRADQDGTAGLDTPPKLPRQGSEVVLFGSASGTTVRVTLPPRPTRRWWRR
ncbi:hypothetical protein BKA23_1913 [Rudaeicoccus suwonensis]|uniref:Uncharacterized protein n=1 Tax=Rudaeicoccus suwonensis TaxID=657409 RepID=A0A561EBV3_9MICO|nr:hypothetical protein BKA23_1913 [Rudaeicoccus suwonensis]